MAFRAMCWMFCGLCFGTLVSKGAASQVLGGYIHKADIPARTVIVFVHGLGGNARETWTNIAAGKYWPDLVYADPAFSQPDILVVDYVSAIRGEQTTAGIALNVDNFLRRQSLWSYQDVVLVAHSLGGIISRQIVVNNPAHAEKVKLMYLIAAPMGGSMLARYANTLGLAGGVVRDLQSIEEGSFLANLLNQWNSISSHAHIPTYCAVEGRPTSASIGGSRSVASAQDAPPAAGRSRSISPGALVVDYASSALLCNRKIMTHRTHDHESIAKPSGVEDSVHLEFRNAFLAR